MASPAPEHPLDQGRLLDQLADGVIVAAADMHVRYANSAACHLLGRPKGSLTGVILTELMPERMRARHREGWERFFGGGASTIVGRSAVRVPALRADGSEVQIELSLGAVGAVGALDGEMLVVATLRDVTDRVELERRLALTPYLQASVQVAHILQRAASAKEGVSEVLSSLCARLDWDVASLWSADDGDSLRCTDLWSAGASADAVFLAATRTTRFARGAGLPGQTWQRGAPTLAPDLFAVLTARRTAAREAGLRCGIAFPMLSGDDVLGVVELVSRRDRVLDSELSEVLGGIGRQLGQFVVRMRSEQARAALAETLQRSLLPPHLPAPPGLELAAAYRAGGDELLVGGDFSDVFAIDPRTWDVVIGDVRGKGAQAATLTALARYTLRGAAVHSGSPAAILHVLHDALRTSDPDAPFLTAAYLRLRQEPDDTTGAVRWSATLACAGHPLPVVVGGNGDTRLVGRPGSLLGVDEPDLHDVHVDLAPGDTLVLYTDGVVEARSSSGRQMGETRLMALLSATCDRALPEVTRLVEAAADTYDGAERDDLAVLALRVDGPPAAVPATAAANQALEWLQLGCDPRSPAAARRFATSALERLGASAAGPAAELVVSELVANAVRHARTDMEVGVGRVGEWVRLEVRDFGTGGARVIRPMPEATSGRGLGLVRDLCAAWGMEERPGGGMTVWCHLAADGVPRWD